MSLVPYGTGGHTLIRLLVARALRARAFLARPRLVSNTSLECGAKVCITGSGWGRITTWRWSSAAIIASNAASLPDVCQLRRNFLDPSTLTRTSPIFPVLFQSWRAFFVDFLLVFTVGRVHLTPIQQ